MQNDGSVSAVSQFFRNKWVKTILILDALAIIAVIAVIIWNSTKTATINFNVAPVDASIQLGVLGGGYHNGTYQVHPGTYDVTVSRDGLTPKTFTLELEPGHDTTLTTFLSDEGNFDFYTFKDNYASFQKLVEIASEDNNLTTDQDPSAYEFIQKMTRILSINDILPIKGYVYGDPEVNASTAGFAIRNGAGKQECQKIACLLVNYYGDGYEEAVTKKIEAAGYDPANYQILYERYE